MLSLALRARGVRAAAYPVRLLHIVPQQHQQEQQRPVAAPTKRKGLLSRINLTGFYDSLLRRAGAFDDSDLRRLVSASLAGMTYAGLVGSALGTCGVDMSPLIAGMGVTGVTAGFAARDILGNYIAGWMLLVTRPFHTGSYVVLGRPADKLAGWVEQMDNRYVYLRGNEDSVLTLVPNSYCLTNVISVQAEGADLDLLLSGESPAAAAAKPTLPTPGVLSHSTIAPALVKPSVPLQRLIAAAWSLDALTEATLRHDLQAELAALPNIDQQKVVLWLASNPTAASRTPEWKAYVQTQPDLHWIPDRVRKKVLAVAPASSTDGAQ
eukprot:m.7916 g.7916  ORF g.7916 m.7916 type:complete len:323 (-) comp4948_c0_seq1:64-1032(-)